MARSHCEWVPVGAEEPRGNREGEGTVGDTMAPTQTTTRTPLRPFNFSSSEKQKKRRLHRENQELYYWILKTFGKTKKLRFNEVEQQEQAWNIDQFLKKEISIDTGSVFIRRIT